MAKVSEAMLYKKLDKLGHKHFCTNRDCRRAFQCAKVSYLKFCESRKNYECPQCRGSPPPAYPHYDSAPCCRNNVVMVIDRDILLSYRLAGPGPWFQCKTCARPTGWPQGFNINTDS